MHKLLEVHFSFQLVMKKSTIFSRKMSGSTQYDSQCFDSVSRHSRIFRTTTPYDLDADVILRNYGLVVMFRSNRPRCTQAYTTGHIWPFYGPAVYGPCGCAGIMNCWITMRHGELCGLMRRPIVRHGLSTCSLPSSSVSRQGPWKKGSWGQTLCSA